MYSDAFCKVYNEFGWNYFPEAFGQQLLEWIDRRNVAVKASLDLGCGTGVLCEILHARGIKAAGMDFSCRESIWSFIKAINGETTMP